MPYRLEIALKPELMDAEGEGIVRKAADYFDIELDSVRTIQIVTINADLTPEQQQLIQQEIFTNPVTQTSSYQPLPIDFDWTIWIGFRPGVRDNPGSTAREAIEDLLGIRLKKNEAIYTSRRYCLRGSGLTPEQADRIAGELLANGIIQQWRIFLKQGWDPDQGIGIILPEVKLDHVPTVTTVPVESDSRLQQISIARNLALNPNDIPVIRSYFADEQTLAQRRQVGLVDPTDVELEYISQARSDHCNHNTFRGLFRYSDLSSVGGKNNFRI